MCLSKKGIKLFWHQIYSSLCPWVTSEDSANREIARSEESKFLKTFTPIHAAGGIVLTVMLPESSRPKAMIGGEEELIEPDELDDDCVEHKNIKNPLILGIQLSYLIEEPCSYVHREGQRRLQMLRDRAHVVQCHNLHHYFLLFRWYLGLSKVS